MLIRLFLKSKQSTVNPVNSPKRIPDTRPSKIRDMGINAIRIVQPGENVVGVKFGETIE